MLAAMEPSLYERDLGAYLEQFKQLLGDRDPFVVQAETPDRLETATRGLSNQHLRTPERPGKWSVIQVAQHLADTEIALAFRSRTVLAEDQPDIPGLRPGPMGVAAELQRRPPGRCVGTVPRVAQRQPALVPHRQPRPPRTARNPFRTRPRIGHRRDSTLRRTRSLPPWTN